MRLQRFASFFLLAVLTAVGLSACDFSEQNYDIEPGSSLSIAGPAEVEVPDTVEYYVRAFTIDKNYTWTVNGNAPDSTWRDGEFIAVYVNDTGTYTISVTATGGGEPEHTGTLEVVGVPAE